MLVFGSICHPEAPGAFNRRPDPSIRHPEKGLGVSNPGCLKANQSNWRFWARCHLGTCGCGSKNRYQNGTLLSGNMDQNPRNPSSLILSHSHVLEPQPFRPSPRFDHRSCFPNEPSESFVDWPCDVQLFAWPFARLGVAENRLGPLGIVGFLLVSP